MRSVAFMAMVLAVLFIASCKSSGNLLGPADETAAAGQLIFEANKDLMEIRKLYNKHVNLSEDLKSAMSKQDGEQVRKITDDVVFIINDGVIIGKRAMDKIDHAREMNINEDYARYLRLKSAALEKQLDAFEEYRQAARTLRDKYDPKNSEVRSAVEGEFNQRSESFQKLMELARDQSSEANELAKEVINREP